MASIGHIAVGMAAARVYRPAPQRLWKSAVSMLLWAALSMLPDADVIGFQFGIKYAAPWGHRGATHSLLVALLVAALLGLLAPRFGRGVLRTACVALVVVGSHALLDTLTDGGLGCALFWPFDNQRHFAPWRPIPVAPIGRRFFSDAGLRVAVTELLMFAPLVVFALWPRDRRGRASRDTH